MASGPIDRASAIDMMELATATTPAAGRVGAVLVLESVRPLDLDVVRSTLADHIAGVPRLRQRLCPLPLGCGRPIWVDDASFYIGKHVNEVRCTMPGDRSALFTVAADLVARRLPPDRPLWSASLVTGLAEDTTALVLIFHHVMATDPDSPYSPTSSTARPTRSLANFPRAAPSRTRLFADAMRSRVRSVAHLQDGIRRIRDAAAELGAGARMARAPRCSLTNRWVRAGAWPWLEPVSTPSTPRPTSTASASMTRCLPRSPGPSPSSSTSGEKRSTTSSCRSPCRGAKRRPPPGSATRSASCR